MAHEEENVRISEINTSLPVTLPQVRHTGPLQHEAPVSQQNASSSLEEHDTMFDENTLPNVPLADTPLVSSPTPEVIYWMGAHIPDDPQGSDTTAPAPPVSVRQRPRRWRTIGLTIVLLLLLLSGTYTLLRPHIPATSATIGITPISHTVSAGNLVTNSVGDASVAKNPLGVHHIVRTTAPQSMTVPATGKGHQDATVAQGEVTVTVVSGNPGKSPFHLTSNSGIKIVVGYLNTALLQNGQPVYLAFAENVGASGNIPAYDIDGTYVNTQDSSMVLSIQNPQPFTGGQDAGDYTFVQQSDIDSAASTLTSKLTDATIVARNAVQGQLASGEQFMDDVQCTPRVTANHKENDRAGNVTVSVVEECTGTAYSSTKLTDLATTQLRQAILSQYGAQYMLVGKVEAGIVAGSTTEGEGEIVVTIDVHGVCVYEVTDSMKKHFVTLVTGQSQDDAQALLLKQPGISGVSLQTSGGLGTAIPFSQENIQISLAQIKGL